VDRIWPAPGKLNLFLRIVGQRQDGYHLLQTLFQFIDRADELSFRVRKDGEIRSLHRLPGVSPELDLTLRAARLLKEVTGTALGADLMLTKMLPLGGGLGGGSSDAATTLIALNQLWATGLDRGRLADLGLLLGADVPVFVQGQAAWAEGVGEKLTFVDLEEPWYVVLVPPVQVSTGAVFSHPELTRNSQPATIQNFRAGALGNDCEPVARRCYPEVAESLDWLAQFAEARLTGTGGCVFAAFEGRDEADRILSRRPTGWVGFVTRGLNRSPLLAC
jgi:4-diphosphocytidyl-2-C-methyl-D-erythritol kinase